MKKALLSAGIIMLCLIIGTALIQVEVYSRASGMIVPIARAVNVSVIQPGIITKIFVKKGDVVKVGTTLAKIDDEEINLRIVNLKNEYNNSKNKLYVLESLINGHKLRPPLKNSILHELSEQHFEYIEDLNDLINYHEQEKTIIDNLVKKQTLPKIRAIEINQKLLKDKKEINKAIKEFWERVVYDAEQQKALIVKLESLIRLENHMLASTVIYSRHSGVIQKLLFSEGEYISKGASFAELIPNHEKIKVKLLVSPDDIGGIKLNQKVRIQVETYNYKIFGTSDAFVSFISPDAIEDTVAGKYYSVECTLEHNYIEKNGKRFELKSGMPLFASIIRGNVSAFNYFIGPLIRSFHLIGVV